MTGVLSGNVVKTTSKYQLLRTDCPNSLSLLSSNQRPLWIGSLYFRSYFQMPKFLSQLVRSVSGLILHHNRGRVNWVSLLASYLPKLSQYSCNKESDSRFISAWRQTIRKSPWLRLAFSSWMILPGMGNYYGFLTHVLNGRRSQRRYLLMLSPV
jgi:hypothetical protein